MNVFEDREMAEAIFRRTNLRKASFEEVNLEGASVHNANLSGASFDDVNLSGATIRSATVANLSIEGAYIRGLTIDGIRVDLLVQEELDRRDPERVRLRITDPEDPECVRAVMARLEKVRAMFYAVLRGASPGLLIRRPRPDEWSAIECVRHLVFAEELYVNRWILRNDQPWSKIALLPDFLAERPAYADVGSAPTEDLESVLAAWDTIHTRTHGVLRSLTPELLRRDTSDVDFGQGKVGGVLRGMVLHDLVHIRQAEAAIAKLRSQRDATRPQKVADDE